MSTVERLRQRLDAAGAVLPEEALSLLAPLIGALFDGLDGLLDLDAAEAEPFDTRLLIADAPRSPSA